MTYRLNLKQRILLGYLVPLALLVVVSVAVFGSTQSLRQLSDSLETSHLIRNNIKEIQLKLSQSFGFVQEYLLFKNEISGNNYRIAVAEYHDRLLTVGKLIKDPQQMENLQRITTTSKRLLAFMQQQIDLGSAGRVEQALDHFKGGVSLNLVRELNNLVVLFDKREAEVLRQRKLAERSALDQLLQVVVVATLLALLLAVGLGLLIAGRISALIGKAISGISSTSSKIAATIIQHERTASQQAAAANETSTTIEQLFVTARKSSEQATSTARLAEAAGRSTNEGGEANHQAMAAMADLKERIGATAEQILRLGEQTRQIGGIATLLKDLSAEINMLALNASVEAARAGEQGKGFAVVASEVRKLAIESKKSAEQASGLVAEVQKTTNASILMTEEGTKIVAEVAQLSNKVGELFDSLVGMTSSVNENAQQVVLNASQQVSGFNQVVEATNGIAVGARETAAGIGQTKIGLQQLNEAAEELRRII